MEHISPQQREALVEYRAEAQRKPPLTADELARRLLEARRARILGGSGYGSPGVPVPGRHRMG